MHARDITVLYPVGTATIVTDSDLSFITKRDKFTNEQGYLAVAVF